MFRSLLEDNKNRGACFGHGYNGGTCSCTGEGKCKSEKCSCQCSNLHGIKGAYGALRPAVPHALKRGRP